LFLFEREKMLSAISNFFQRMKLTNLERAHAQVSWEEALDEAVLKINELKDVDSAFGKLKLAEIISELKEAQSDHQETLSYA